jgi:hypothetical protein
VAPETLEVRLDDGGTRELAGDQVFLNVGTRGSSVPGLRPPDRSHIEALELDYLPTSDRARGRYVGLNWHRLTVASVAA